MTDPDPRPSNSDHKTLSRRPHCQGKCQRPTWHRQTGPYLWTCRECETTFKQNPWVTDNHPLIEPPIYEGENKCQNETPTSSNATIVTVQASVLNVTEPKSVPNASVMAVASAMKQVNVSTAKMENAMPAMVQAAFL